MDEKRVRKILSENGTTHLYTEDNLRASAVAGRIYDIIKAELPESLHKLLWWYEEMNSIYAYSQYEEGIYIGAKVFFEYIARFPEEMRFILLKNGESQNEDQYIKAEREIMQYMQSKKEN